MPHGLAWYKWYNWYMDSVESSNESKIPSLDNTPSPSQLAEQPVKPQEIFQPAQTNTKATGRVDSGPASPNTQPGPVETQTNLGQVTSPEQLGVNNPTVNDDVITRQVEQMGNAVPENRSDLAGELMGLINDAYWQ